MKNTSSWQKLLVLPALALLCVPTMPPARADTLGRTLRVEPQGTPTVPEIDAAVQAVMQANGAEGASLAIVKDTRLVYAKGYTWATPQTPDVLPTTLFRQASVSKLFAALATFQLIEEGKLTLDTPIQSVLQARLFNGRPPSPAFGKITVRNLLEMDSGIEPGLPWRDVAATKYFGTSLPVTSDQLAGYAAGEDLISAPGDKAQAFYNNSDYLLLGQVVAKKRGAATFIRAIEGPLLSRLHITRVRESRSLESAQLPDEAHYSWVPDKYNPNSTDASVMTPDQPQVPVGYGDTNMDNDGGAGGLSGAATDVARVLAALSVRENNPVLPEARIREWLGRAAADCTDKAYTHTDADGNGDAFGFYGLDYVKDEGGDNGAYWGYKGGYLSTSQNGVYFERGGLSYVICWNKHTPKGEHWYPAFQSVLDAAGKHEWGSGDLFPRYGMPTFGATPPVYLARPGLHLQPMPAHALETLARPVKLK